MMRTYILGKVSVPPGNFSYLQRTIPNWRRVLTVSELETVELKARIYSLPQIQSHCLWACSTGR